MLLSLLQSQGRLFELLNFLKDSSIDYKTHVNIADEDPVQESLI
jgi:hypothetical protein